MARIATLALSTFFALSASACANDTGAGGGGSAGAGAGGTGGSTGGTGGTSGGAGGASGGDGGTAAGAGGTTAGAGGMPFVCDPPAEPGSLYEAEAESLDIEIVDPVSMCQYRNDVLLIVNTAGA